MMPQASVNPNQAVIGGQQQQLQPPPPQQAPPQLPHGTQPSHAPTNVAPPTMVPPSTANIHNQNSYHYAATTQGNPQTAGYPNTAPAPTQAIFYVSNVSITLYFCKKKYKCVYSILIFFLQKCMKMFETIISLIPNR